MNTLIFIFILFIVLHAIYNLVNYLRFNHIEDLLYGNYTDDISLKTNAKIHKNQILNYIKNSGVKDKCIPIIQPLGYGQLASSSASVFNNILNPRQDIAQIVMDSLLEAKGNYLSKFLNSFNPFYWLRIIIFIPKYIFEYLGLKEENIIIKIFQIIYWILAVIFTFFTAVFPKEIKKFIFSIIHFS